MAADFQQTDTATLEGLGQFLFGESQRLGRFGQRRGSIQDRRSFPVPLRCHLVEVTKRIRRRLALARNQCVFDLGLAPDKELPFLALAVCILRGVEATFGGGHFPEHPVESLTDDLAVPWFSGCLVRLEVTGDQQRVVVEHFFEVRHQPDGVGRVAMESAAELIVESSAGHAVEREAGEFEAVVVSESRVAFQEQSDVHRVRKLGSRSEASVFPVAVGEQCLAHLVEHGGVEAVLLRVVLGTVGGLVGPNDPADLAHRLGQFICGPFEFITAGRPGLGDVPEDVGKARHAHRRGRWPVGTPKERPSVGRHEHRHRPTAAACQ